MIPLQASGYSAGASTLGKAWPWLVSKIGQPAANALMGSLVGGISSRLGEGAMEAGETYTEALRRGMAPEQANKAANSTFFKNLPLAFQWTQGRF